MVSRLTRESMDQIEYLEAQHDGYARLKPGVLHRRRVLCVPGEYWILADDLLGTGDHVYDFWFHFGPSVGSSNCERHSDGITMWSGVAGLWLGLFASGPLQSELIHGREAPVGGWVSRGYGHKRAGLSLCSTLKGSAPVSALTMLAPVMTRPVVNRLRVEDDAGRSAAIACSYEHRGFRDIAVSSNGDSEIAVEGFRMKGEFFWIRMEHEVVRQTLAVRPSHLRRNERNLLGGESCTLLEDAICAASAAS